MNGESAVRLAGELARQFGHLTEEEAADRVVEHVVAFWEPRLRAELLGASGGAEPLADPVVNRVAALLAQR